MSIVDAPLVSVIVPVYNVEDYLDQALVSIERQTLTDLEIIVIDDGSTDASGAIMDAHRDADPRIHVVHKQNAGYGAACNVGLTLARGTWVALVEPDDWIEPTMLETLVEYAEQTAPDADVVKASYFSVTSDDPLRKKHSRFKGRMKQQVRPFTIQEGDRLLRHHPSVWSALYRRAFLEDNHIRFKEEPGAGWVDNVFLYDTLLRAKKILYVDESLYDYREESAKGGLPFTQAHPEIVLQRWLDMDEVLRALEITSPGVLGAHTKRALNYIDLVLPHLREEMETGRNATVSTPASSEHSREATLMDLAVQIMDRLDPAIVFSEAEVAPHQQDLFALFRNLDEDTVRSFKRSPFKHYRSLVSDGIANMRANGLGDTFGKVIRFSKK